MIVFYIMCLSTKTLRNAHLWTRPIQSWKNSGDDENYNKNRRKGGPTKVFWYFPIIPHLKHCFANKESELLRWHKEKHKQDAEVIRHLADATQWWNIDSWNLEFAIDPRNIRIAMSTDGMNPFMNSAHIAHGQLCWWFWTILVGGATNLNLVNFMEFSDSLVNFRNFSEICDCLYEFKWNLWLFRRIWTKLVNFSQI
jgi:hypothetical protein